MYDVFPLKKISDRNPGDEEEIEISAAKDQDQGKELHSIRIT